MTLSCKLPMRQHSKEQPSQRQLLPLPANCIQGKFLRRVKRFSIEFEYQGQKHWAHTNNSGTMLGLLTPGSPALFSASDNPKRKLPYTLERIKLPHNSGGHWVGVNTLLPNQILEAAFNAKKLDFCSSYSQIKREAKLGASRLDALCTGPDLPPLWIECKNVTLVEDNCAAFPDAQSQRAQKHLRELLEIVKSGARAAMFYLVQRPDGACFGPADYIDEDYAKLFWQALALGVEAYAYRAVFSEHGTNLGAEIPLIASPPVFEKLKSHRK